MAAVVRLGCTTNGFSFATWRGNKRWTASSLCWQPHGVPQCTVSDCVPACDYLYRPRASPHPMCNDKSEGSMQLDCIVCHLAYCMHCPNMQLDCIVYLLTS